MWFLAAFLASGASAQQPIPVGVVFSATGGAAWDDALVSYVAPTQEFSRIARFDASAATPAVADFDGLSALLVWNDQPFADAVALGDAIGTYARDGGGVVLAGGAFAPGTNLEGLFATQGFMPVTPTALAPTTAGQALFPVSGFEWKQELNQAGHLVLWSVNNVDLGISGDMASNLPLAPNAVAIASWSNGETAVVTYESPDPAEGRIVVLNFRPIPDTVSADGFDASSAFDVDHLIANALLWSARWEADPDWCYNRDFLQDLNCNHIDASDEAALDTGLTGCESNVDPRTSLPYDNADYYFDLFRFDCGYPTLPYWGTPSYDSDIRYDGTADWLSSGTIDVYGGGSQFPTESDTLTCDNCGSSWNLDQQDRDCDGIGDDCDLCVYEADAGDVDGDADGWGDQACDDCPAVSNPDQADGDLDLVGDACDDCADSANADQADGDLDGVGDTCDDCPSIANSDQADRDADGLGDACDDCVDTPNADDQGDADADGLGDACDNCAGLAAIDLTDSDGDGIGDACDSCPAVPNVDQADGDADGFGNACDDCPLYANPDQADGDEDGVGDLCDNCLGTPNGSQSDADADGLGDICDNCPLAGNDQHDRDGDGWGDACDLCLSDAIDSSGNADANIDSDGDGLGDACDNCPYAANADQSDDNADGEGDVCDRGAIRGGGSGLGCGAGCATTADGGGSASALLFLALLIRRRR